MNKSDNSGVENAKLKKKRAKVRKKEMKIG